MRKGRLNSVKEIDSTLDELQSQIAELKKQRKEAKKVEREQARRWRAECLPAIGEAVLEAIGCEWNELDIAALMDALGGGAQLDGCILEGRESEEAKKALDDLKRGRKRARKADVEDTTDPDLPASVDVTEAPSEEAEESSPYPTYPQW